MQLHSIPTIKGESHRTKRLGTGRGSGHGGTSTRGHKGGKARSGYSPSPVYSGIPFYRKFPIRGFNNFNFRTEYEVINLSDLARVEGVTEITREVMIKAGLVRNNKLGVKVLAEGEISKALVVYADKFSLSAKQKIEAAGGKAIVPVETNSASPSN
ncbi:MAG: 50S ribosomal protein L15 [Verrucomicrobia bacterium GWC2_42_7]|nr:MAG: 50S ribosomal protein L15 [Verrucomicrobia bacterium GWC2_42_7]